MSIDKSKIHVLGVADEIVAESTLSIIKRCHLIVASNRFTALLKNLITQPQSESIFPIAPLSEALVKIQESLLIGDVAVMASGDPLFFGIGKTLCEKFGSDRVELYPALSSMQLAFARFKINWDDAFFLSLHGRKDTEIFSALTRYKKLFFFTDAKNSPDKIAAKIIAKTGLANSRHYYGYIAENIGQKEEKITSGSLEEISKINYSSLNVMLVVQKGHAGACKRQFGLAEEEIQHSRGLITKNEIRAVAIHQLNFENEGVFWDIGAGSGSVSIECARLFPKMRVYSIEKNRQQIENLRANREKYCCWNMDIIEGTAPSALIDLPEPDRVFIGGNGGHLEEIIDEVVGHLAVSGRIVLSAILEKTLQNGSLYLYNKGFQVDISEVQVKRFQYPEMKSKKLNAIKIITASNCKIDKNKRDQLDDH